MISSTKKKEKRKHRDHRDMIACILETLSISNVREGTNITRLMYRTGSAWNDLLRLLDFLVDREMISKKVLPAMTIRRGPGRPGSIVDVVGPRRNHTIFFITPKGTRFLHLYTQLIECFLSSPHLLGPPLSSSSSSWYQEQSRLLFV